MNNGICSVCGWVTCEGTHAVRRQLIGLQPDEELKRKALKSLTHNNTWTQEEFDLAERETERIAAKIIWG